MYTKFLILFFCFLSFPGIQAQNEPVTKQLPDVDSFSSLSIVYGWSYNPNNGNWTTKENEIKDIDKFNYYSIVSFHDGNKKYIAIVKESEQKGNIVLDVYVLNYLNYVEQITLWEEHAILKFPIYKHTQVQFKKGIPVSKELLGLNDLSNLLAHPRDYFVFQYRFLADATVKFLFYVESCSSDTCLPTGLNTKDGNTTFYKYIGKEELYNNFFYKTTPKYFTRFSDSPVSK